MYTKYEALNPIEAAREMLERNPIILDTETTGLGQNDEIVEIAIIGINGDIKINTLIRPVGKIPAEVTEIHGITNKDVENAPSFNVVWEKQIGNLLRTNLTCIYNSDFDVRLIRQTLNKYGLKVGNIGEVFCIMKLYAEFKGQYKWYKLGEAARQCRLRIPENLHNALADAELTRRLLRYIGSQG